MSDSDRYLGEHYGDDTLFAMRVCVQPAGDIEFHALSDGSDRGTVLVFCPADLRERVAKRVRSWWRGIEVKDSGVVFAGREVPMSTLRVDFHIDHAATAIKRLVELMGIAMQGKL